MSANLLLQFDSFYQTSARSQNQASDDPHDDRTKNEYAITPGNFETGTVPAPSQQASTRYIYRPDFEQHAIQLDVGEVEDEWGDFEAWETPTKQRIHPEQLDVQWMGVKDYDSIKPTITSGVSDGMSGDNSGFSLYPLPKARTDALSLHSNQMHQETPKSKVHRGRRDVNILFDAEEDQEEDEFEDFKVVEGKSVSVVDTIIPQGLLLDFNSMVGAVPVPLNPPVMSRVRPALAPSVSSFGGWNQNIGHSQDNSYSIKSPDIDDHIRTSDIHDSSGTGNRRGIYQQSNNHPVPIQIEHDSNTFHANDDVWDDIESNHTSEQDAGCSEVVQVNGDFLPLNPVRDADSRRLRNTSASRPIQNLNHAFILNNTATTHNSARPDNIPPPSMLLPLFTSVFSQAQVHLFAPLASQSTSLATREAILSHPETQTFLASYLAIAGVLNRILAGRKLRWKRDTFLNQSIRIGPASASGKSSGMKLTGVDKTESTKEEREVADVIKLWRSQLGRLRSAVAAMGSGTIPDITEHSIITIAKESEGGLTVARACALCGLKRNERIAKLDFEVQDCFGEWWIEHWGHRACKSFWDIQRENLSNR